MKSEHPHNTPQQRNPNSLPPLHKDPYALAYRYREYMAQHPMRFLQYSNPYFEKLLANLPAPEPEAMDDRSRAIRYAKEHYESFYEIRDIRRILSWLPAVDEDNE